MYLKIKVFAPSKKYLKYTSSSSRICLIALRFYLLIAFTERKKEGTIQYGYRKWGTHARVFSQTLAHGQQEANKIMKQMKEVEGEA